MRNLEGKVAVVTGAGHGIGRETALALADKGCRLAICDVNQDALDALREEIEAGGKTVTAHRVDVSDKAQMEAFAPEVVNVHGEVHILVNNAGVTVYASFEEHSIEDLEWILGVNLWGRHLRLQVLPPVPQGGRRGAHRQSIERLWHHRAAPSDELRGNQVCGTGF
jgi:NAD(P)-dependent dehydrogenase (short-subunit alcohol dehydrogenase family)